MWTSISNMSVMRYKCVGVTWKGKIYLVGGFASRVFIMERSSAEVYDTKTGKWEVIVGMWQLDVPPNEIVAVNKRLFSSGECLKPWKGHCYGPCCLLYGPKPLGLTVGVQL
ncbi:hypothetical protein LINGRAPRIM_LOCUS434 [Linum grandiflorum]